MTANTPAIADGHAEGGAGLTRNHVAVPQEGHVQSPRQGDDIGTLRP